MFKMSIYFFSASFVTLAMAVLLYAWHTWSGRQELVRYATALSIATVVLLSGSLLTRSMVSGYGPFSNMYEFSASFALGVVASYLYVERQYRSKSLGVLSLLIALALMIYASTLPSEIQPLVPALQNNLLLTIHVTVAIIAYGAFAVAFAAAVCYLLTARFNIGWLPEEEILDDMAYKAVVLAFPMMTLVLIVGALWADIAWGRYWSWDPKETASLLTWLMYGGYLHARVVKGWQGQRSAWLLVLGFAATLFTFYGNYFFGGLHSYGGVN